MKAIYMMIVLVGLALETGAQTKPVAEKCHAITKSGAQCSRNAKVDGYCTQHNPKTPKCGVVTKAGTPCKVGVKVAGQHCHNHTK